MHKYFFTTKDTFISSGSNETTGEDFKDKNTQCISYFYNNLSQY